MFWAGLLGLSKRSKKPTRGAADRQECLPCSPRSKKGMERLSLSPPGAKAWERLSPIPPGYWDRPRGRLISPDGPRGPWGGSFHLLGHAGLGERVSLPNATVELGRERPSPLVRRRSEQAAA